MLKGEVLTEHQNKSSGSTRSKVDGIHAHTVPTAANNVWDRNSKCGGFLFQSKSRKTL
jgi:hypothetical protein